MKLRDSFSRDRNKRARTGAAAAPRKGELRIVTYNIHKCRGLDRRVSPERIARVLADLDAGVIALQEVVHSHLDRDETDQARAIAGLLGMHCAFGQARAFRRTGRYGNAVLSRFPILGTKNYDITANPREPRACLRADIETPGGLVHVFNVHLGTGFYERRRQAHHLVSHRILNNSELRGARVMLGDFNEWTRGLTTEFLTAHLESVDVHAFLRRRRTYPGVFPFLHLDHVYFDRALALEDFRVHRSRRSLVASDHLPLVGDFGWRPAAG
jgi:endonuclease/exonuclease/phosphatase family metal-dependent hydrolase